MRLEHHLVGGYVRYILLLLLHTAYTDTYVVATQ